MLTPAQCRSARSWLNWTQAELAKSASVGLSTVRDFESEIRTPIPNNLGAIRRALEGAGAGAFLKATDDLKVPKTPAPKKPDTPSKAATTKRRKLKWI